MKQAELVKLQDAGEITCQGMYWSGRLDKTMLRDKQNPGGARREAYVVRETIMTERDPISVSRWLKDDEKPADWKPSASKGDRVVVVVRGMEVNLGSTTLQGNIEKLEK